jgi:uncharacterized protein YndB with AHSA1/START domain
MEGRHVSRASIEIEASSADVWDALVNPATAKEYFFGAKVRSDWKEGSPITFTGEFNGNAYHEKGTILQYRPERLLQYSHWSDLEQLPDLRRTTGTGPSASNRGTLASSSRSPKTTFRMKPNEPVPMNSGRACYQPSRGSLRPGLKAWPRVHWIHETHEF